MRISNIILASRLAIIGISLGALTVQGAELTRYYSKPGNLKMRIEGTSTIHDWQVQGSLIGGFLEVGPSFPIEPGQAVTPGKMEAHGEAKVSVRSLFSVEKDGRK